MNSVMQFLFGRAEGSWRILIVAMYVLLLGSLFLLIWQAYIRAKKSGVGSTAKELASDKLLLSYFRRQRNAEEEWSREGAQEKVPLMYRVDRLIDYSGLRNYVPWMTADILAAACVFLFLAVFFVTYFCKLGALLGILFGISAVIIIYTALRFTADRNFEMIENDLLSFVNAVGAESRSSDDIILILDNVRSMMCRPLRLAISRCVEEARQNGRIDVALYHLELSVENEQFKIIIRNLEMCSETDARYGVVVDQCRKGLKEHISSRIERKGMIAASRVTMVTMVALGVLSLVLIGQIIEEENVFKFMWSFLMGRVMLIYIIAVLFWCIISLFVVKERD